MASLTNQKIKDTYEGLLKTSGNEAIDGAVEITDGAGNSTGVTLSNDGQVTATGTVSFGSLKDTGEDITVEKFVDEADGIANNDNDTSIPTSAAVKDYVDTNVTAQDLDFQGDNGTGAVDLDSQVLDIAGTANEIETSASGQTLTVGLVDSPTVSGTVTAGTLTDGTATLTGGTLTGDVTGDLTGDVTGDVTGSVTGNVTGNLTGNVTGNVTGDITGDVTGDLTGNVTGNLTGNVTGNTTGTVTATSVLADGVAATTQLLNDNSTKVATTAYVDAQVTAEDLDFSGNSGSGQVDLDSESLEITGSNGITTTALNNTLDIDGSTLETSINANASDISTNASNISTNAANITSNDSDISSLQTDVSTNTSNISTNASNISSNDTDIATNVSNIATNTSGIATNVTNIATNASNISSNDTDISNLQGDVSTNTGNISTNATNISSNDTDISNLQSDKQNTSEKNQANGYAPLDSGAKIPIANLPDSVVGQVEYQGTWNASTNTPSLPSASTSKGHYYVVATAGTYQTISYAIGDWVISNGTAWEKVDNTDAVTTVFGRLGAIVANESDYSGFYPLLSDLSTTNSNVSNNTSNITTNATDITTNETDISTNASNISANTTNISTNATNIASNDTDIATNSSNIATNSSNIATNASDISTNASGISTNVTNIAVNTAKVSNVTTNLSATANGTSLSINSSDGTNASIPAATTSAWGAMTDEDKSKLNGIDAGATNVTNNNQLTNGAGYITDGNSGWNNTYGFITASSSNTLTNKGGNISQWTNNSGYITSASLPTINNGTLTLSTSAGLDGGASFTANQSGNATFSVSLDLSELTDMTAGVSGANDELILLDSGAERRKRIGEINLGQFNNDQGWTSNVGDITGVTAGNALTGGGTSGSVTVNLSTEGPGAGTYGSTSNSTKIDNITLDAYGRIQGISTGATGSMSSWTIKEGNGTESTTVTNGETFTIAQGTGIQSEMTSTSSGGTIQITNTAPNVSTNLSTSTSTTSVTVNSSDGTNATIGEATGSAAGVMSTAHHNKLDGIAASATNVTNNNQISNGRGFITGYSETDTLSTVLGRGNTTTTGAKFYGNGIIAKSSSSADGNHSDAFIVGGASSMGKPAMYLHGNGFIATSQIEYGYANTGLAFKKTSNVFANAITFGDHFGNPQGSISVSGTTTTYNTTSDYRLKENVIEITDGIDRVKQLQPKRFNFISEPDVVVDGFIAHEAQEVVPEAVTGEKDSMQEVVVTPAEYDDEGNVITEAVMGTEERYQGIDQSKIVPLLTAALQEAIDKIEDLEARILTLENN